MSDMPEIKNIWKGTLVDKKKYEQRIAELEATIAELRGALEKIADLRNRAIGWEFAADIADAALLEEK